MSCKSVYIKDGLEMGCDPWPELPSTWLDTQEQVETEQTVISHTLVS
jgi:hypothetical protein